MKYVAEPNLVLESLIYLGLRASRYDQDFLESRLTRMGCRDLSQFQQRYGPFTELRLRLDQKVQVPQELLTEYFTDLAGFPSNTAGAYSIALLLFAPAASQHTGDLEEFLLRMAARSQEEIARDLLISFDYSHLLTAEESCVSLLKKNLPSLPLTKRSRKTFLDAQKNYLLVLEQIAECLRPAYEAMDAMRPALRSMAQEYAHEISNPEVTAYLWENSVFPLNKQIEYHIRPLLIDPSSNLFFDMACPESSHVIYCGVLQNFMRKLQRTATSSKQHMFECMHLLGDQTRFEIFCYLSDHPAYGQELSDRFNLARNTIHHHMSKLFEVGLVRCMVKGARVYYSIDKNHYKQLLEQQEKLFLDTRA